MILWGRHKSDVLHLGALTDSQCDGVMKLATEQQPTAAAHSSSHCALDLERLAICFPGFRARGTWKGSTVECGTLKVKREHGSLGSMS